MPTACHINIKPTLTSLAVNLTLHMSPDPSSWQWEGGAKTLNSIMKCIMYKCPQAQIGLTKYNLLTQVFHLYYDLLHYYFINKKSRSSL